MKPQTREKKAFHAHCIGESAVIHSECRGNTQRYLNASLNPEAISTSIQMRLQDISDIFVSGNTI